VESPATSQVDVYSSWSLELGTWNYSSPGRGRFAHVPGAAPPLTQMPFSYQPSPATTSAEQNRRVNPHRRRVELLASDPCKSKSEWTEHSPAFTSSYTGGPIPSAFSTV